MTTCYARIFLLLRLEKPNAEEWMELGGHMAYTWIFDFTPKGGF